jgi:hypothetical protein
MPTLAIGGERFASSARDQMTGGIALPVIALTANVSNLNTADLLRDGSERCTGLNRLQLLRIADQHHLCPGFLGMGQHALHLARANHACFIYDQHIAFAEKITAPCPSLPSAIKSGNVRTALST